MAYADTIDKVVNYFHSVTNEPFDYKGETYEPMVLQVSPNLLRGFTCPAMCGGCCPKFSLDYIDSEPKPYDIPSRVIRFNSKDVVIWSDMQKEPSSDGKCHNLNRENGRCNIHGMQPFSCDFELVRFRVYTKLGKSLALNSLFGRGWAMKRVDGGRGALCEIIPPSPETVADVRRKMVRLKEWTDHFGLNNTKLPDIISWIDRSGNMPYSMIKPLTLGIEQDQLDLDLLNNEQEEIVT